MFSPIFNCDVTFLSLVWNLEEYVFTSVLGHHRTILPILTHPHYTNVCIKLLSIFFFWHKIRQNLNASIQMLSVCAANFKRTPIFLTDVLVDGSILPSWAVVSLQSSRDSSSIWDKTPFSAHSNYTPDTKWRWQIFRWWRRFHPTAVITWQLKNTLIWLKDAESNPNYQEMSWYRFHENCTMLTHTGRKFKASVTKCNQKDFSICFKWSILRRQKTQIVRPFLKLFQ